MRPTGSRRWTSDLELIVKKPRKTIRLEPMKEERDRPREQPRDDADATDATDLKVDELEPRVVPRSIGTFF